MQHEDVVAVLADPVSRRLIDSSIPVRLAYTGLDGFPRVIPISFHWDGARFFVCTLPHAPKVKALQARPQVALTIDTNEFPPNILLVRGTASIDVVDGLPDEYLAASRKQVLPEGWDEFEAGVRGLYKQMARIAIVPEWAKVMDFETRLPGAVEQLIKDAAN